MQRLFRAVDWRYTFVVDALLFALLLVRGTGLFGALLLVEVGMWVVRLLWLSPMMLRFIARRLVHMIPIVLLVIALGFLLIQLAPGDIIDRMSLDPDLLPGELDRFRRNFGLDQAWYVQFFKYLFNVLRGDFGLSWEYQIPVFTLVRQRAAATLLLSVTSLALGWGFSIPAGIAAATHQYKWQDQSVSVLAFVGLAIPNFFLAFLLIYFIGSTSSPPGTWLPLGGMTSIDFTSYGPVRQVIDVAWHMIVPVIVLGTSTMAGLTRIMRANMLEIMNQQYITTARSKGQTERNVVYRHALRNAINPMITILGFQISNVLAGAALTEIVLSWPGLGRLTLNAILGQDLYLVIGGLIYSSVLLVIGNLLADIALAIVDPRIRIG